MRWLRSTPEASRKRQLIAVAALASVAGLTLYALGALQSLQNAAIDESFALTGSHAAPADVVIVAVDNYSLQKINSQLPIPRSYYARLLDVLRSAKPRLIGLDIQFTGVSAQPRQDSQLLRAFADDGPVLVSVSDAGTGVPSVAGVRNPRGVVAASGAVDADSDGVIRKLLYVQVHIKTFAIRAAEIVLHRAIPATQVPANRAWIDYAGPPGTFRAYSMENVLEGRVPPTVFAGKIVLVGVSAPIAKDVFITSASSVPMSGVEVQANAIETALRGFPLRSASLAISLLLIVALAIAPVLLTLRLNPLEIGLSSMALVALFLGGVEFAFAHGLILPVPDPLVGLGIGACGVIAVESLTERRQRLLLQAVLKDYLRPAKHAFFVSYRRDQSSFIARSLRDALVARFGEGSVFLDESAISPGGEWPREIQEAILGCSAMLVIIGPYWLSASVLGSDSRRLDDPDDWVRREVEGGLARPEVAMIPLLVDGAKMPESNTLPPTLDALTARQAFVLTGSSLENEVEALVRGIRGGDVGPLRLAGSLPAGADPRTRRRAKRTASAS